MGPLIFALTTVVAVAFGGSVLSLVRLAPRQLPERFLASAVLGYVLLAYGIFTLGLLGHLTLAGVGAWLAVAFLLGLLQWRLPLQALVAVGRSLWRALRSDTHALATTVLLLLCALTYLAALAPPGGNDFDGLAEHLAQAATYVRHGSLVTMWHDHHSFFPATLQMLYALALLGKSVTAAKLFHWFMGILALGAVALITRRHLAREATVLSALVLASTPLFYWLSGLSYVDLATTATTAVAVLFLLAWVRDRRPADLLLTGVILGCGMTTKMQGVFTFAFVLLLALALSVRRAHREGRPVFRSLGPVVAAGAIAVALACPWYVRTTVLTGNPFFPFAYNIFGGRHWSADRAEGYERHQLAFGYGELPASDVMRKMPRWRQFLVGPREPWKWLAAPVLLTFNPMVFEVQTGKLGNTILTALGPLYLALLVLLVFLPGKPPAVRWLGWLFLPMWLWWFTSMQLARYLLPNLTIVAPLAGYAAWRALRGGPLLATATRWTLGVWLGFALLVNVLVVMPALPVLTGHQSVERYLARNLEVYLPSSQIARSTPANARVATYGEVRTFYFDRDALWAEYGHSDLIPYHNLKGPADLIREYRRLGVTHVLVNTTYLPGLDTSKEPTLRLLRESINQGYLRLAGLYPARPSYRLYAVSVPEAKR